MRPHHFDVVQIFNGVQLPEVSARIHDHEVVRGAAEQRGCAKQSVGHKQEHSSGTAEAEAACKDREDTEDGW